MRVRVVFVGLGWFGCVGTTPEPSDTTDNASNDGADSGNVTPVDADVTASSGDSDVTPLAVPPPFDDVFVWAPLLFDDAPSQGHRARRVATNEGATGITFVERGIEAGLGASQSGGADHGVGVGLFDVNGDSAPDIFLVTGHQDVGDGGGKFDAQLYLNSGDGTFVDASHGVAALAGRNGYSVGAGDIDNDGDLDVYVGAHPTAVLLRNDGSGVFEDVTHEMRAGGPVTEALYGVSKIVNMADIDSDGRIDLAAISASFEALDTDPFFPKSYLLVNQGERFADVTEGSDFLASPEGHPCALMFSDHDNDGDQDALAWNDIGGVNNRRLLVNNGGVFTDRTGDVGLLSVVVRSPMGIDAADIDRNGYLDFYLSNIGGHPLLMATLDDDGQIIYVDGAAAAGVAGDDSTFGWGLGFEDFNLDGYWDLFVAQEDGRDYLAYEHLGLSSGVPTYATHRIPQTVIKDLPYGNTAAHNVSVAFGDVNMDGLVDVVTAGTDGSRLQLFQNETDVGSNGWLHVRIPDAGDGQAGGISARVVVKFGDTVLWRDINGGSSRGAQNQFSARFGIPGWDGVEWVAALWPDGRQSALTHVQAGRVVELPAPQIPDRR